MLQPISCDDIEIYTQIVRNPHIAFHFSCSLPKRSSSRDGVIIQASWTRSKRRLQLQFKGKLIPGARKETFQRTFFNKN